MRPFKNGGRVQNFVYDKNGRLISETDTADNSAISYTYDAFGNENSNNTDDSNSFGYNGEYLDRETGLIYLRARYYDSSIGRFISEDPIKDGSNWYAFCNNNPVTFIDPSGMKLTCDEKNSERIISLLREISGNSLALKYADGQINITKTYDTKNHVGQTLVSDLINALEEVYISIGLDPEGETNSELPAYESAPMQIFIYPDNETGMEIFSTYVQQAEGKEIIEEIKPYIVFGHELVHAWRAVKGLDIPSREEIGLIPKDAPQLWREEELQTMGINYTDEFGNPIRRYNSYIGIISENGLRLENNLNRKISYRGF